MTTQPKPRSWIESWKPRRSPETYLPPGGRLAKAGSFRIIAADVLRHVAHHVGQSFVQVGHAHFHDAVLLAVDECLGAERVIGVPAREIQVTHVLVEPEAAADLESFPVVAKLVAVVEGATEGLKLRHGVLLLPLPV